MIVDETIKNLDRILEIMGVKLNKEGLAYQRLRLAALSGASTAYERLITKIVNLSEDEGAIALEKDYQQLLASNKTFSSEYVVSLRNSKDHN